jgi:hypothetical protein
LPHILALVCASYFSNGVSLFYLGQPVILPIASCVAGITTVSILLVEWGPVNSCCPGWPWVLILPSLSPE